MNNFGLPENLTDKIYEIKIDKTNNLTKLITYFPLSNSEKKETQDLLGDKFSSDIFHSIFSDQISDENWEKSKTQIKEKFQNELFDIDKI